MKEHRQRALFGNHLRFLQAHRGNVKSTEQAVEIRSDKLEYTYALPERGAELDRLLRDFRTLHIAPWGRNHLRKIPALGLKLKGGLSYMELKRNISTWASVNGLAVTVARHENEIAAFSDIQCRGFLESPAAYDSWAAWLTAANLRNLNKADQRFYVGRYGGTAAGVVLTVSGDGLAGIYAVATKPEFRKKGISTALMKRAIEDAAKEGCDDITLQVARGSSAEAFYKKLGFETAFEVDIFGL